MVPLHDGIFNRMNEDEMREYIKCCERNIDALEDLSYANDLIIEGYRKLTEDIKHKQRCMTQVKITEKEVLKIIFDMMDKYESDDITIQEDE